MYPKRFLANVDIYGLLNIGVIPHELTDQGIFLLHTGGEVRYRTTAEIREDLQITSTNLVGVDAANISGVTFTHEDGSVIIESFSHVHTEYALEEWVVNNFDKYISWGLKSDGTLRKPVTTDSPVDFVGGTNIEIIYSGDGVLTFNSTYITPDDEYVDSIGFNTDTGVLTLGRNIGSDLTTNLDNRYSLLDHTHTFAEITSKPIIDYELIGDVTGSVSVELGGNVTIDTTATPSSLKYLEAINATNISSVAFTLSDGSTLVESFSHVHSEYALEEWVLRNYTQSDDQEDLVIGNGLSGNNYDGQTEETITVGMLIASPTGTIYTN